MSALNMKEACMITGMSRKRLTNLLESKAWDIGEVILNPKTGYKKFIIWSHKLANVMGIPEDQILQELSTIDHERRESRAMQIK